MLNTLENKLWPLLEKTPGFTIPLYSAARPLFIRQFNAQTAPEFPVPPSLQRVLWGLTFASPLMNAAGMFKNGEGYILSRNQGAGAYLAGTTTYCERRGNRKNSVTHPFVPYRRSHAGSNFLGLPNKSHGDVASRLQAVRRYPDFPVGASISLNDTPEEILDGMHAYLHAEIDFLELNESCPNISHKGDLEEKLSVIADRFLKERTRTLPVIVKFSTDTPPDGINDIVQQLISYGFDGANFGNTSTRYSLHKEKIHQSEHGLYDAFTATYGGGVSGNPLKEDSLLLAKIAVESARHIGSGHEFNIIRTGGIETAEDIIASDQAGIALNQWFTGYFMNYARYGHETYQRLYSGMAAYPSIEKIA